MEYNLKNTTLSQKDYILDTVAEQPVDADITLPDYCPDIEKILSCSLLPKIYMKTVSGGQLSVDGAAVIRILYIDSAKGNIRCFEHTVPFSSTFPLKSTPQVFVSSVDAKPEYMNCRAMSPRKLSLHGAFSLYPKVIGEKKSEFFSNADDSSLRVKTENISVCDLRCMCEEPFSHVEDISFSDKPPVEALITAALDAKITELKSIGGKIMLTAQAELRLLYLSDLDSGEIEHLLYTFPVSRVIDCDGVTDETVLDATLKVNSYDIRISSDALSEGSLLTLDVKFSFCAFGYEEVEVEIITDAYATDAAVELTKTPKSVDSDMAVDTFTNVQKAKISLGDANDCAIGEVVDLCCDSASVTPVGDDDGVTLQTKVVLSLLLCDKEKKPFYAQRTVELDVTPEKEIAGVLRDVSVSVESLSYRIIDDKNIEVRMELCYKTVSCKTENISPVTAVDALDIELENDDSSLVIYYAECGENVWDIAKAYRCDPDELRVENALESDELTDRMMLLIPVSH